MKNCPHCLCNLSPVSYEGLRVFRCEQCRGHLLPSRQLEAIKRLDQKTQDELMQEANTDYHGDGDAKIHCPRCRVTMRKHTIKLPGLTLQLDACRDCDLIWLDGGELALIQLGHESTPQFRNAQELRNRMDALESSPERKAAFEENLAKLPDPADPISDVLSEAGSEVLRAILREFGYSRC